MTPATPSLPTVNSARNFKRTATPVFKLYYPPPKSPSAPFAIWILVKTALVEKASAPSCGLCFSSVQSWNRWTCLGIICRTNPWRNCSCCFVNVWRRGKDQKGLHRPQQGVAMEVTMRRQGGAAIGTDGRQFGTHYSTPTRPQSCPSSTVRTCHGLVSVGTPFPIHLGSYCLAW